MLVYMWDTFWFLLIVYLECLSKHALVCRIRTLMELSFNLRRWGWLL